MQDDWRASDRLTLNIGARWTLHFPSTEKTNQGAVFNLADPATRLPRDRTDIPAQRARTALGQCGSPVWARLSGDSGRRSCASGFGIVFIDQSGITTPFTTPQFPFIQNVQQKTQDIVNAAFGFRTVRRWRRFPVRPMPAWGKASTRPSARRGRAMSNSGTWRCSGRSPRNLSVELAYVGSHIVHVGIPDSEPEPAHGGAAGARSYNPTRSQRGAESVTTGSSPRPAHRRQDSGSGATAQAVSAVPERSDVSQQLADQRTTTRSKPRWNSAFRMGFICCSLTPIPS